VAIAPLSDIVLDVAGAADPVKRQEAIERLAKLAGNASPSATVFSEILMAHNPPQPGKGSSPVASSFSPDHLGSVDADRASKNKVYEKFEAVFLQNFIEAMLPKDEEIFGDAASADISRSMMAEQLAQQMAKTDKLGLVSKILAAHPSGGSASSHMLPVNDNFPVTLHGSIFPSFEVYSNKNIL